jgi:uncharacterized membrane protein
MGHVVFAVVLIALGIQGLLKGDFVVPWQPVPQGVPARELLVYLSAGVALASGMGLLWRRTAALAARVLLASFVLWLLLFRVRALFLAPLVAGTWSCGQTLVMAAAAWVLLCELATGERGLRLARVVYGLGLIPFGYAHFAYVKATADLVPGWLPWHVAWAYVTGGAFVAAALAVIFGVWARLATVLSALQMGLFGLLVWVPRLVAGSLTPFQRVEVVTTVALTAAGWVVAGSFAPPRSTPGRHSGEL